MNHHDQAISYGALKIEINHRNLDIGLALRNAFKNHPELKKLYFPPQKGNKIYFAKNRYQKQ